MSERVKSYVNVNIAWYDLRSQRSLPFMFMWGRSKEILKLLEMLLHIGFIIFCYILILCFQKSRQSVTSHPVWRNFTCWKSNVSFTSFLHDRIPGWSRSLRGGSSLRDECWNLRPSWERRRRRTKSPRQRSSSARPRSDRCTVQTWSRDYKWGVTKDRSDFVQSLLG